MRNSFVLLSGLVSALFSCNSLSSVEIYPHKIIFEPGQRSAEVLLINSDDVAYTYRMGWNQLYYSKDGSITADPDVKTAPASNMFRYAPRQVILQPGESQSIRVMVRRPKDLKDGEYRSHMLFQQQAAVPTLKELKQQADQQSSEKGFQMKLYVALGMTIPVIVRQGQGEAVVTLSDVKISKDIVNGKPSYKLDLILSREGEYSSRIYIDVEGEYNKYLSEISYPLYTDSSNYHFSVPLPDSVSDESKLKVTVSQEMRKGDSKVDNLIVNIPE